MSHRRWVFWLLLLACGLGFALRVYRLDVLPFWYDEGLSVDLAIAPPAYVLETINRPPLYYILLHFWVGVAGVNAVAFRFFSAWWGVLALPLVYRMGRQLLGQEAGAWALGLAALSSFYIYYAQEARTYTLTLALALASSWALLAWWNDGRRRWLALYALATLACLYTHYAALTLPLAQTGFLILTAWREGRARWHLALRWLAAMTIVGLLFAPWPLYARHGLPQLIAPQIDAPLMPLYQTGARTVWTTLIEFSAGRALTWPLADGIAMLFLFLIILGVISVSVPQPRHFLLLLLTVPPLALFLLPRTGVYFEPKYLIVASPAFYLLAVAGLESLRRESRLAFSIGLILVLLAIVLGAGDWLLAPHKVA